MLNVVIIGMGVISVIVGLLGISSGVQASQVLGRLGSQGTYKRSWRTTNVIIFLLIWVVSLSAYVLIK